MFTAAEHNVQQQEVVNSKVEKCFLDAGKQVLYTKYRRKMVL
jgi:hypothetical protein